MTDLHQDENWQTRIAAARAVLVAAAPHLSINEREAMDKFFAGVEQMAEEVEDDDRLRGQLAALLTGVANGLKGKPRPLHHHDWSDLPVVAVAAMAEIEALRAQLPSDAVEKAKARGALAMKPLCELTHLEALARIEQLEAVWHNPAALHVNLLRSGYPRDLALHLAGATDYDYLVEHFKTVQKAATAFSCWWAMHSAQEELAGEPIPDSATIFHFMGSGASTTVTAGQINAMLNAIYGEKK